MIRPYKVHVEIELVVMAESPKDAEERVYGEIPLTFYDDHVFMESMQIDNETDIPETWDECDLPLCSDGDILSIADHLENLDGDAVASK